jgi:hypothetical protein
VDQNLGVPVGGKEVTAAAEILAQIAKVVDLTVQYGPDGSRLIGDRWIAVHEVDDRQPVLGDDAAPAVEPALRVRATVPLTSELILERLLACPSVIFPRADRA